MFIAKIMNATSLEMGFNYVEFRGTGMSKSPKKAVALAKQALKKAYKQNIVAAGNIDVLYDFKLYNGQKLVLHRTK